MEKEGYDPNYPIRIYMNGVFDILHYGHMRSFEKLKKMFPYVHLIIGVCSDYDAKNAKGKPVFTAEERAEMVRNCKWVDEVIVNCKLPFNLEDLDKLGCKYIAHDPEPYPYDGCDDVYGQFKKANRFIPLDRGVISTTEIINRILSDYDMYIERNVRKGLKPKEMKISNSKYFGVRINILIKNLEKRREKRPLRHYFIIWRGKSRFLKNIED